MINISPGIQVTENYEEFLEIMPLGAGCEVGRSCLYIECKGRKFMLDCGLHPAKDCTQALPYFDMIHPEDVDLLLLTHFHVDHCAGAVRVSREVLHPSEHRRGWQSGGPA